MGMKSRMRRRARRALAGLTQCLVLAFAIVVFAPGIGTAVADWQAGQTAYERGDIAAALEAWRPLAEAGDARAQAALGSLHIQGEGVAVDYEEALRWTRLAAGQGDVTGQFNMGTIYAGALGVERNYATAAEWFTRAAEQDDAASRYNLGILYARGLGVPRDDEEALFMLSTATIITGDPEAKLLEIGAAAENYAYVVMMAMKEAEVARAIKRTKEWEKEFLRRYLMQRRGRPRSDDALAPLPFE